MPPVTLLPLGLSIFLMAQEPATDAVAWDADPVWYDGLVEKATYDATRVIYGRPRTYEAVFLTNKEQHDTATWTKDMGGDETVEVWKHNQIEVVPTPNYDYKFTTTSHTSVDGQVLTRLDMSESEYCGTTFKQYLDTDDQPGGDLGYFSFSYMPASGRVSDTVAGGSGVVAFNSLPLYLRGYDFNGRADEAITLLPDQKSNRTTPHEPVEATITYAEETDDGHVLTVTTGGEELGTFTMAKDRLHVMLAYEGDGQTYELKGVERVNYWTIEGE